MAMLDTPDLLKSSLVTTLLSRSPIPPLIASKVWRTDFTPEIDQLDASLNVRAVLHLLNDDYNACHTLAEEQMGDQYADHIHCIAHRREPDYGGSRFFVRRLSHPHLAEMYVPDNPGASPLEARKALRELVNTVQSAEASGEDTTELEQRQWAEMTMLTKLLIEKGY